MAAGAGAMDIQAVVHKPFTTDEFEAILSDAMDQC
jgi:hypothetical protein